MEISVHGIFILFIVFLHFTNSERTGTSGRLWDSLGYAWKDMHCATVKPLFFLGSSGHSVSDLAKTTFPLHLTDTIIFKGFISIAPTMPHSCKIPHKFCCGGDLTDYYGISLHERDFVDLRF